MVQLKGRTYLILVIVISNLFTPVISVCPPNAPGICRCDRHDRCFLFVPQTTQWVWAQNSCERYGGTLAAVRDDITRSLLTTTIHSDASNWYELWLGGFLEVHNWKWSKDQMYINLEYLGCFSTQTPMTDGRLWWNDGYNSPAICTSQCQSLSDSMRYAVIHGNRCYCHTTLNFSQWYRVAEAFCRPQQGQTSQDYSVYDLSGSSFVRWFHGRPTVTIGSTPDLDCAAIEKSSSHANETAWHLDYCERNLNYICEHRTVVQGRYVNLYTLSSARRTWFDADTACKNTGGSLAQLSTQGTFGVVSNMVPNNSRYWIGLSRRTRYWASDTTMRPAQNGICLALQTKTNYNWQSCSRWMQYVCQVSYANSTVPSEIAPTPRQTTIIPTKTTIPTTTPTIPTTTTTIPTTTTTIPTTTTTTATATTTTTTTATTTTTTTSTPMPTTPPTTSSSVRQRTFVQFTTPRVTPWVRTTKRPRLSVIPTIPRTQPPTTTRMTYPLTPKPRNRSTSIFPATPFFPGRGSIGIGGNTNRPNLRPPTTRILPKNETTVTASGVITRSENADVLPIFLGAGIGIPVFLVLLLSFIICLVTYRRKRREKTRQRNTLWAVIDDDPKLEPLPRTHRLIGTGGQVGPAVYTLDRGSSKYRYVRRVPSGYAMVEKQWPKSAMKKNGTVELGAPFKKDGAMEDVNADDTVSSIIPDDYPPSIYVNYSGPDARTNLNDSGVSSGTSHSSGNNRRTTPKQVVSLNSNQTTSTPLQPYGPAFGIERLYDDAYTAF